MLIGEAIQRIQSAYSKGAESDDSRLTNRYIYSKLRSVRERLLSQEIRKKQKLSQWSYQTISCVEMEVVPSHECPCVPYEGCTILRSKYKIPSIFTDADKHLIQSVSTIDGSIQFSETTLDNVKYQSGNKFTPLIPQFFIHNDYLYLTNKKSLAVIMITALFEDPIAAAIFSQYCDSAENDCKSYLEFTFPFDGKLEEALFELTKEEVYLFLQIKEDRQNNAVDDASLSLQRLPRRQTTDETQTE